MNINWKRFFSGPLLVIILIIIKKCIDFIYPIGENNFLVAAIVLAVGYFGYKGLSKKSDKNQ